MHSQELPGRIGSGMSCVTLQTITSVFKYPIKCRDQFCKKKKNSGERKLTEKSSNNYQYKQFKAWKNCCIFNWSDSTFKHFFANRIEWFQSRQINPLYESSDGGDSCGCNDEKDIDCEPSWNWQCHQEHPSETVPILKQTFYLQCLEEQSKFGSIQVSLSMTGEEH